MAESKKIVIKNRYDEYDKLISIIDEISERNNFSPKLAYEINLVFDEIITNIISYAYNDEREHDIEIEIIIENDILTITILDDGIKFDPTSISEPDLDVPVEDKEIGGLGIFLVKKVMDSFEYCRSAGRNKTIIKKKLKQE
ncbi:MAG: ATP-binding protein [Candidatus Cloacimonetes bacterium]|nr:ATP-binding protein [Candidatus Cloacimonadota bacterium]